MIEYLLHFETYWADIPTVVWLYLLAVSLTTFCFYGFDKYQAKHNRSRIPETVLHLLTLAGGTIGAIIAQRLFHHKTKKLRFRLVFMLIVITQAGFIALWILSKRSNM